jgi:hypothetical protein
MREVDSSRMVFTQVPSRVLSGADEGRLDAITEEARKLFNHIKNDVPVIVEPTPSP